MPVPVLVPVTDVHTVVGSIITNDTTYTSVTSVHLTLLDSDPLSISSQEEA